MKYPSMVQRVGQWLLVGALLGSTLVQFTTISTKLIRYNEAARGDAMPVISTVTINDEPHPITSRH